MAVLLNHDYPGNIRELENILEHALIVSRGSVIDLCHLPVSLQHPEPPPAAPPSPPPPSMPSKAERTQRERRRILAALEAHEGHRGLTAASLGMDRSTLWRKMKRLGIHA
jgi:DNA-binding NtrC family response regulator